MRVFVCEPSILETGDSDFVSDLGLGFGRLRIASLGELKRLPTTNTGKST